MIQSKAGRQAQKTVVWRDESQVDSGFGRAAGAAARRWAGMQCEVIRGPRVCVCAVAALWEEWNGTGQPPPAPPRAGSLDADDRGAAGGPGTWDSIRGCAWHAVLGSGSAATAVLGHGARRRPLSGWVPGPGPLRSSGRGW